MKEAILIRRSIRTYKKQPLSISDEIKIQYLLERMQQIKSPFSSPIRLWYHSQTNVDEDTPIKIGTYGFIKNAPGFVLGATENESHALIDFSYVFEGLILELTQMNLGTVWLGGTFQRGIFKNQLNAGEFIPAITPVGHSHDSLSLRDRFIRKAAKGDSRLPHHQLFFHQNVNTPWIMGEDILSEAFDCVRMAPSASNKQPWRMIATSSHVHLYLARTPNYAKMLPFDIQLLDMGIALCHLVIGLELPFSSPPIVDQDPQIDTPWEYIASLLLP